MGVDSLIDDGEDPDPLPDDVTLGELRSELGDEAVNRGVNYMFSLVRAQEEYRSSGDTEKLKEGFMSVGVKESEDGHLERTGSKWAERMEERGLGLDNE